MAGEGGRLDGSVSGLVARTWGGVGRRTRKVKPQLGQRTPTCCRCEASETLYSQRLQLTVTVSVPDDTVLPPPGWARRSGLDLKVVILGEDRVPRKFKQETSYDIVVLGLLSFRGNEKDQGKKLEMLRAAVTILARVFRQEGAHGEVAPLAK